MYSSRRRSCRSRLTQRARLVSPGAEARGYEVRDDVADVALLRRPVVGARVVTGDRHGPAPFALLQLLQKARGVIDVLRGIEHRPHRTEFFGVVVMIDLHAAEIDQLGAFPSHGLEAGHRIVHIPGKYRLAFGAERVRVQRASAPGLGQADRVQDAERDAMKLRRARHLALARTRVVRPALRGGATDKQRRDDDAAPRPGHDASPGWSAGPYAVASPHLAI